MDSRCIKESNNILILNHSETKGVALSRKYNKLLLNYDTQIRYYRRFKIREQGNLDRFD